MLEIRLNIINQLHPSIVQGYNPSRGVKLHITSGIAHLDLVARMLRQYYIGRREMMDHWGIIHNGYNMPQHQVARIQLEEIASTRRFAALHTRLVFEGTRHGMFGLPHGQLVENFDSKYHAEFMAALPPYERPGHNSNQLYEAFRCLVIMLLHAPATNSHANHIISR